MNIRESLISAMRSLRANKVRSGLTMLGIIIGVGAVIALMAIGEGARMQITGQIESVGSNLIFISPGASLMGGVRLAQGTQQTLTYEDALAIGQPQNCPSVALVAPMVGVSAQLVYKGNNSSAIVNGVTADYATMRNMELAAGEFISPAQVTARARVVVLGANIAKTLFGDEDPLDKNIRVNNMNLRVIGVLAAKGGTGFGSEDDQVYAPITMVQSYLSRRTARGGTAVSQIIVQAADANVVNQAMEEVSVLLRERHRITTGDDDFSLYSQAEILGVASQITGVLTTFLGGIAAISLLVGGIGIMNIMLVSVTERTREIGIRKAVGAKKRDILVQFLTEAMLLSVLGGLIGIVLGWALGQLVSALTASSEGAIEAVLTLDSVLLATGFSLAVGLFFGIYPAWRAASLHPIDALRYE